MSDQITVTQQVNQVTVTEMKNVISLAANGVQGPRGTGFLNGAINPTSTIGVVGDFYLNTTTSIYYGPKDALLGWPTRGINLIGISGGAYNFEQSSNVTTWNITHNLGFYPNVSIIDYGSNNIEADIVYPDGNHVTINFAQPTSGYAYLS